jgi:hypothetical protein
MGELSIKKLMIHVLRGIERNSARELLNSASIGLETTYLLTVMVHSLMGTAMMNFLAAAKVPLTTTTMPSLSIRSTKS